jgi:tRNA modification GTPase
MTLTLDDTIAAIATAAGGALRGIVRVSGPTAVEVVAACLADESARRSLAAVRGAEVVPAAMRIGLGAGTLPCELFVWPDARSYTRQPVVEIHTIGSPPVLDAVLRAVCAAGARLAGPGEFTLRAFLSGRLDLAQAEAVLGVIDAQDRRALDVALAQLAGGLSRPLGALRDALVDLLADLEAGLDFVDEDIEFVSASEVARRLEEAAREASAIAGQLGGRGERSGVPRVVLVGAPNAGKSSLFNVLCGSTAIVSPVAGTTRDAITARVEIEGVACELVDTAGVESGGWGLGAGDWGAKSGIRESGFGIRGAEGWIVGGEQADSIESAAQLQTKHRIAEADVEVWCVDPATAPGAAWELVADVDVTKKQLLVVTKVDTVAQQSLPSPISNLQPLLTSSVTGAGMAELRGAIARAVYDSRHAESSVITSTAVRCQESLRLAIEAIEKARQLAVGRGGDELVAAEIRLALVELGKIVGVVYTDDILDRLFGRFCIGK